MKHIFLSILFLSIFSAKALYTVKWKHFPGTIYLKNKDSIAGEVLLYLYSSQGLLEKTNFLGIIPQKKDSVLSNTKATWIKFKDIDSVKIFFADQDSTIVYKNLSYKKTLWRRLLKNDSVAIYHDMIMPHWGLQYAPHKIILVSNQKIIEMYSNFSWFFHNSKTGPLLKRFINKRYHTHFKKSDFIDEDDELRYILKHG